MVVVVSDCALRRCMSTHLMSHACIYTVQTCLKIPTTANLRGAEPWQTRPFNQYQPDADHLASHSSGTASLGLLSGRSPSVSDQPSIKSPCHPLLTRSRFHRFLCWLPLLILNLGIMTTLTLPTPKILRMCFLIQTNSLPTSLQEGHSRHETCCQEICNYAKFQCQVHLEQATYK